jgi:hypothetical protein
MDAGSIMNQRRGRRAGGRAGPASQREVPFV